ncbi:MAG: flagellar hook associated protein [Bradyrhizobium sp.]
MAINSVSFSGSLFGQAVLNLNNQLTNLSTQLATGEKSTTYAGMGINEGFAIAARQQLSSISAFSDTQTNINTTIGAENTALQSISSIATSVQGDASTTPQTLNSTGQTIGQANAQSQLVSLVGILNTQVGDRYIFSGSAISTPSVASVSDILNGNGTQAGLTQVIAQRAQADGTTGLGRLVISTPTTTGTAPVTTSFAVSEDSAGSPFGLKLSTVQSTLTGATVTGPSGSPASVSFSFGATNPNPGDQVTLNFNLPDGTTSSVTLTASSANPPPTGTFAIGSTPAATAANLNAALNTSIGTLANTTLVAASAVAAGNDFFDPSSSATGTVADNQAGAAITAATSLSGTSGNALTTSFQSGDTITVNGTAISFSATAPTSTSGSPYVINTTTGTVGNLLSAIDSITGTTTPSSVDGGAVTINTPSAASFSISASSSDPNYANEQGALAALGFGSSNTNVSTTAGGTTITAPQPPLRVSTAGSVTGAAAVDQETTPQAIASSTALSGAAGSASLPAGFQNGDAISVNGKAITFSTSSPTSLTGPTYNIDPTTGTVGNLLSAIDSITGGTASIKGGAITINTPNAASFSISALASDPTAQAALASLGFSQAAGTATNTGGSGSVTGAAAVDQETTPQPIASSTALSGAAGSASLSTGFADGDAITVNGTTITFSNAPNSLTGPTFNINPATSTVGNLLSAIDSITGTTTPSSITGGAVSINTPSVANFSITASSSDPNAQAALAALGFSPGSTTIAATGGTNITANATTLVNGSANTVAWYTGNNSADPRASANALVDSGISVNYGIQANEQAIRQQLEGIAVYAAVTESPTGANSAAQAAALSTRVATNLTSQPGQQQISDIQTDLANAQTTIQAASARQTQSQSILQNMIDSTETVSTEQVASQILAIQSSLSASYQTTSMLSQLTLTKFLSGGL